MSSSPPPPLARSDSTVELIPSAVGRAVTDHGAAAQRVIARAVAAQELEEVDAAAHASKFGALDNCVYVGHTNTDMDSIGSAIGCAELFGGLAARASEVNSETAACLQRWGIPLPPLFKEVPNHDSRKVCLVDHQQTTQMAEGVKQKQIRGIIDHHSLKSETVVTSGPVYVDIRPWGSACTIVAYTFFQLHRTPSPTVAGMLLSGILSDTLNLQGPTTTDTDRMMVAALASLAKVQDINELASFQFRAKSEALYCMTDTEIVMGDHKVFKYNVNGDEFRMGFGVVECVGEAPARMLARKEGLKEELVAIKNTLNLRYSFLAIVDMVKLQSTLIVCGLAEHEAAAAAFGGTLGADGDTMDLGGRVSRKNDFLKLGLDPVLKDPSFQLTPPAVKLTRQQSTEAASPVVMDSDVDGCCGRITRANKLRGVATTLKAAVRLRKMVTPRPQAGGDGDSADGGKQCCSGGTACGSGNAASGAGSRGGGCCPSVLKFVAFGVVAAAAGYFVGQRMQR